MDKVNGKNNQWHEIGENITLEVCKNHSVQRQWHSDQWHEVGRNITLEVCKNHSVQRQWHSDQWHEAGRNITLEFWKNHSDQRQWHSDQWHEVGRNITMESWKNHSDTEREHLHPTLFNSKKLIPCVFCPLELNQKHHLEWKKYESGVCPTHGNLKWKMNKILKSPLPGRAFVSIPDDLVELRSSGIHGAGQGMFAKVNIEAGTVFGPYDGVLLDKIPKNRIYTWQLYYTYKPKKFRDAFPIEYSNWIRWVNMARFEEEQNMVAFQLDDDYYYVTYKLIKAGDELLVWYGDGYARTLLIPICKEKNRKWMRAPSLACYLSRKLFTF
ncbi:hypothetical protein QYM36_012327 [Artemia franciscana]|uniref:SET domain-containing protein n=1 Tax=Artemia franciscana TaxID=6661 RepID=A0AA88HNW5_ARTSF|nr:hypothetical protein QYM36_012327 [Artemia franciscana]